jgi:hypothetical protein
MGPGFPPDACRIAGQLSPHEASCFGFLYMAKCDSWPMWASTALMQAFAHKRRGKRFWQMAGSLVITNSLKTACGKRQNEKLQYPVLENRGCPKLLCQEKVVDKC